MEKKKVVIISLVSAVLSLIYLLLSYFGILRYTSIYLYSVESYSKNYTKLDHINSDHRVVISLVPGKLDKLDKTVKSLLDQTVRVDLITLVLPKTSNFSLPPSLKDVVHVFRCGSDYGELNCLIPTLLREGDASTRIVLLGTRTIYGKDFLETLLEEAKNKGQSIIYTEKDKKGGIDLSKGVVVTADMFSADFIDNASITQDKSRWFGDYVRRVGTARVKYKENYRIF